MTRKNPRSTILDALREGPRHLVIGRKVARHLCKLVRNKQVVRLPDGRHRLRNLFLETLPDVPPNEPSRVARAVRVTEDGMVIPRGTLRVGDVIGV